MAACSRRHGSALVRGATDRRLFAAPRVAARLADGGALPSPETAIYPSRLFESSIRVIYRPPRDLWVARGAGSDSIRAVCPSRSSESFSESARVSVCVVSPCRASSSPSESPHCRPRLAPRAPSQAPYSLSRSESCRRRPSRPRRSPSLAIRVVSPSLSGYPSRRSSLGQSLRVSESPLAAAAGAVPVRPGSDAPPGEQRPSWKTRIDDSDR